jgi:hypothetical protein
MPIATSPPPATKQEPLQSLKKNEPTSASQNANPSPREPQTPPEKSKKSLLLASLIFILIILGAGGYFLYQNYFLKTLESRTYEDCVNSRGSQILESLPSICITQDGQRFTQPLSEEEKQNLISSIPDEWKTYTNQSPNFSFKYPPNYQIKAETDVDFESPNHPQSSKWFEQLQGYQPQLPIAVVTITTPKNSADNETESDPITIYIFNNPETLDADQWFEKYNYYPFYFGSGKEESENPKFPFKLGSLQVSYGKFPSINNYVYALPVPVNQHMLILSISSEPGSETTSYQILSTFQFTDSAMQEESPDNESESEFECPDKKVLDCSPCTSDPCPMFNPQYCSKGSAQYNWIIKNCPDVQIIGLE